MAATRCAPPLPTQWQGKDRHATTATGTADDQSDCGVRTRRLRPPGVLPADDARGLGPTQGLAAAARSGAGVRQSDLPNAVLARADAPYIERPTHASSSSNTLASWRSAVSNPSVNQP